jgi:hypothetical protein
MRRSHPAGNIGMVQKIEELPAQHQTYRSRNREAFSTATSTRVSRLCEKFRGELPNALTALKETAAASRRSCRDGC